jgi:hypothetical protein
MGIESNKHLLKSGLSADVVQFGSRQEMVEAMADKRYSTDSEYRDLVAHMLRKGFADDEARVDAAKAALEKKGVPAGRQLEYAMSDREGARRLEDEAIFREQSLKMFSDPRYEKSPTFRREVEDWIRANTPAIDAAMPKGSLIDRNLNKGAVRVTFGEGSAEASRESRDAKQAASDKAALAEKHARVDAGLSSEVYDLGGQKA